MRRMRFLRNQGYSLRQIGARLLAVGLRPRASDRWHAKVVRRLLGEENRNPAPTGPITIEEFIESGEREDGWLPPLHVAEVSHA